MEIIRALNISKNFTGHCALEDVSVEVPRGTIYGLLGPNGAGKTTLIRIINHITAPDKGEVWFGDHLLTAKDVANIGYLPEERGLYKKMRVGEQAIFFARLKGLSRHDAITQLKEWFERFDIMPWWNKKVEELSKGMAQKVQFIVTVLHRPELLIFDEPFSGFDPINAELLKNEILNLRRQGATVIFSTHNMESVETLCDDFTLINKSHNILSGNVQEVRTRLGRGRYLISFRGDASQLLAATDGMLEESKIEEPVNTPDGLIVNARLRVRPEIEMRQVIANINQSVEIVRFDRALPSMNDIFIHAVESDIKSRSQIDA